MDATKLIEEAEWWAKNVSESPGNGTAGEDLYGAKLLFSLAAALRETAARADKVAHERDEWMRRAEGWESEAAIATERKTPDKSAENDLNKAADHLRSARAKLVRHGDERRADKVRELIGQVEVAMQQKAAEG